MPARALSDFDPETRAEIERFVHLHQHLWARKAGWETALAPDCWDLLWFGFDSLPEWAQALIDAGEPGTRWCPKLVPSLRARE